jgi:octaprenyl-diphosphate synthase
MFVFLSAGTCGIINDTTYRAASLIELLHTATLVHDDVVDDSNERRGFFSLNALWKNKIAVLVGDYLLSKGLLLSLNNDDFELLKIVSNAVKEMSEGELLQIEKARRLDISEEIYFNIITQKTASLIASCCESGASSVKADSTSRNKMKQFGELTGIAFQLKDDLFDYEGGDIGKPTGIDIREKKLTLPIIYTLKKLSSLDRRKMIYIIKNENNNTEKVGKVIQQVYDIGGITYAEKVMNDYKMRALNLLNEFPKNEYQQSLEQLVTYTTERKK